MAIRPTDIQGAIFQASQTAPLTQRAEEAPRLAQMAAQAQFEAAVTRREERVAEAGEALGSRVDADAEREPGDGAGDGSGERRGRTFDAGAGDGWDEPPHLVDVTA